jgi:ABC-type multidrug transport system permease subunit
MGMSSVLVRNKKRKLLANYLNSIASGAAIGGTLPMFAAWALGTTNSVEAPFFLMIFAFVVSYIIQGAASRHLNGLEEQE